MQWIELSASSQLHRYTTVNDAYCFAIALLRRCDRINASIWHFPCLYSKY
ncbi:hypothetical protein [Desmonostoc muscorum]|uniref:Uncharacterized protein n=1 Tax=Desmonostoc muscorum LEGE 12446 TaxID=1828758 RepID=A0A8J7A5M5_DESMC|nr:hypothetical protein [Desmonostoc muscorum]